VAQEAVALAPDNPALLLLLGRAQLEAGNSIGAKVTLTQLAQLAPGSIEAWLALAEAHRLAGELVAARTLLEQGQTDFVDDPRVDVALGYLALAEGKTDEALVIARTIQSEHPENANGYLLAGEAHLAGGNNEAAVSDFASALSHFDSPSIVLRLGAAREKLAGAGQATETYYRWLDEHPHNDEVRIALAQALSRSGEAGFAIKEFERVLQQRPDDTKVINNLAWLYGLVGKPEALDLAKRGYELAPNDAEMLDTYGWLLLQNDQVGEALQQLQRAANLAPHDAEIRYHLAAGFARAGSVDKARVALEEILGADQQDIDPQQVRTALENLH
jgi:putative PEP-CTERM system TPR-repeat lipoprotein